MQIRTVPLDSTKFPWALKKDYWELLMDAGLFERRFCVDDSPTIDSIHPRPGEYSYYVWDLDSEQTVGEYTLSNFTGAAAQVHFSVNPRLPVRTSIRNVRHEIARILWEFKQENGDPYVLTLFGLTPVTNQPAVKFIQKVHFEIQGILPYGIRDRGRNVDAVVSIALREKVSWAKEEVEAAALG